MHCVHLNIGRWWVELQLAESLQSLRAVGQVLCFPVKWQLVLQEGEVVHYIHTVTVVLFSKLLIKSMYY